MLEALQFSFFQKTLVVGVLVSIACGIIGTYVVVKRIASISGGLSHAAFGGVGLGYWLGFDPLVGATLFSLLAGAGVGIAYRRLRSGLDTLIAMVWSVGMALGILFVSLKEGYAPELMSFLFGSLLFVPTDYIALVVLLDLAIVTVVTLLYKEFRAVCFDEEFAQIRRVPVEVVFLILLALISLVVVTLIRVVGVILVIALLTIPAATARQWSESLVRMMVLASALGAFCTVSGLFIASYLSVPTGPAIILVGTVAYGASSALRLMRARD
ncbi:MAG: metal ABC transporter permease [Planctomycetota bacterium]